MIKAIDPETSNSIKQSISQLESTHNITGIVSVESGSRAWGFPSKDSDYDVRMIYYHPKDWYLSVFEAEDNFSVPITGLLDIAGWDIRKCLRLLHKGNAVVHEWLNSPIQYKANSTLGMLQDFAREVFNPAPAFYHYLSMAKKKLALHPNDAPSSNANPTNPGASAFTAKRLLYGYRTLLCAKWIHTHQSPPPLAFQTLLAEFFPKDDATALALEAIIKQKETGSEQDTITENNLLAEYADKCIKALDPSNVANRKTDLETYNKFFRRFMDAAP